MIKMEQSQSMKICIISSSLHNDFIFTGRRAEEGNPGDLDKNFTAIIYLWKVHNPSS